MGGNKFYDQKNEIPIRIPELTKSGIGKIVEFRRISAGFPNQARNHWMTSLVECLRRITPAAAKVINFE
jgi:hypothetical protein